jgi:hypothetical protein
MWKEVGASAIAWVAVSFLVVGILMARFWGQPLAFVVGAVLWLILYRFSVRLVPQE